MRELLGRPVGQVLVAALGTLVAGLHRFYLPDWDLDPSWQAGMSMAQDSAIRFGPDLVFTYGPLAWLDTGAITTQSIAQWRLGFGIVATFIALLVALRLVNRRLNPLASALLVVVGIAPMMAVTAPNEELVAALLTACLLIVVRRGEDQDLPSKVWVPLVMGMGVVGGILVLTKFSAGMLAFAILALISLALLPRWPLVAVMWASFLASVPALWLILEGNLTYFVTWLQRSSVIASTYAGAMASYDVTVLLGVGFAAMGVIVTLFAVRQARALGFSLWFSTLVLLTEALAFYIGWKLAFVRIEPLRVSAVLVMLTPLVVWAVPRVWPPLRTALAVVALPLASLGFASSVTLVFGKPWPLTSITVWPNALKWSTSEATLAADLDQRREELAERYALSPEVQELLANTSVHIDPVAISAAWAYGLN